MDRTIVYAIVVGAILIVAFFALWRGTGGSDTLTGDRLPPASSTGPGSGTPTPSSPPAK